MRAIYKTLSLALLFFTVYIVFMFGGFSLIEGYNIFEPYIDTEFAENYTPQKFDKITTNFTKEEVVKTVGQPLFKDNLSNGIQYTYTIDGYLKRKSNKSYAINDFAWYRSYIYFDSTGKILKIDKGWSYD